MRSFDIRARKKVVTKVGLGQPEAEKKEIVLAKRRPWLKFAFVAIPLVGFAIGVLGFLVLPEAKITVSQRTEPVTRDLEIRVDVDQGLPDVAGLAVPGTKVEQEESGTEKGLSTGVRNTGAKASGFVYVYNFSKNTLILKSQTTVLTAPSGKKYIFAQDVSGIRPTALLGLEEQEVDPTSLVAPVPTIAELPGEEYNLPKGTRLEIRNEAFGSNPKTLYAVVSEDQISGGSTRSVKVVTDGDIKKAHQSLTAALVDKARDRLAAELGSDTRLLDRAYATEILESGVSVAVGREQAEFEVSQKIKLQALLFHESDAAEVVMSRVARLMPDDKTLRAGEKTSLDCQYKSTDLSAGQGLLLCHFEGLIEYQVDTAFIRDRVRGRTPDEIKELLLSRPEIASVDVKFLPFWVSKAPVYNKRIQILIQPTVSDKGG